MTEESIIKESRSDELSAAGKSGKMGGLLRNLLPWIVTVLIFVYIFRQVPLPEVMASFKLVRLDLFIPVVFTVFPVFFITDTLTHHLVFTWLAARTRFFEVMFARGATYILSMLNFFAGQGGIGYWLSRTKKVPGGEAASTIVFVMFMELFLIMVLSAMGIILMPEVHLSHFLSAGSEGVLVRTVFITLGVLLFQVYIWSTKPPGRLVHWLLFRGPFQVFDRARFRHFAIIFVIKLFMYIVDIFGAWVGLKTFGVDVPLVHMLTYLPLIYLIGSIPVTVLRLGTTQAAWLFFFSDLMDPATIIAFSVLWSFSFLFLRTAAGLVCLPKALSDFNGRGAEP